MAERRMLLNSTESFVGTMRIEYNYDRGKLPLVLNNNIKIIEEYYEGDYSGYYVVGFKKDLIVPEDFINPNNYCEIDFNSDYNITFDTRSVCVEYQSFYGNFTFNELSIISTFIELHNYNYKFNNNCFDINTNNGSVNFYGKTIPQYYKNTNNYKISANPHILYDLMKYNNIEEGDEEAQKYSISNDYRLIISSPTEYITTISNVDLGNNNYIKSVNNYMYDGNYITEYSGNGALIHLRKGITLPQKAIVYFPNGVTDIDSDTFESESNLKKVIIFGSNNSLTYLDGFKYSSLETIEIYSDEINSIENNCFYSCEQLIKFIIPINVLRIAHTAFGNCTSLESIIYKGTIEEWNNIDIESDWCDGSAITTIHCSDGDIQL